MKNIILCEKATDEKDEMKRNFYKLMVNSVYSKNVENVHNLINLKIFFL